MRGTSVSFLAIILIEAKFLNKYDWIRNIDNEEGDEGKVTSNILFNADINEDENPLIAFETPGEREKNSREMIIKILLKDKEMQAMKYAERLG